MQTLRCPIVRTGLAVSALIVLLGAGCPPQNGAQSAKLTFLFTSGNAALSGNAAAGAKARVVGLDEIESLKVTIESIGLIGETYETEGPVPIVTDPFDVELVGLLDINELIESAEVPPGNYRGALIQFANPMLTLAADPGTVIMDVDLPDNGFFQIPAAFTMVENSAGLLVFDLGGITLIELDSGGYQLVPDLTVDLFDTSLVGQAVGKIAEIDRDEELLVLKKRDMRLVVDYSEASIFLPDDFSDPSGTPEDLAEGQELFVLGAVNFDGSLTATVVVILDEGDDDHSNGFRRCIKFKLENEEEVDPDAHGRAHYKEGPNRRRFELHAHDLAPVEAVLIRVDGELIADARVRNDKAHVKLDTKDGDDVPEMAPESVIEVLDAYDESVVLFAEGGERCEHDHDDDDDDDDDDEDDDDDDD